MPAFEPINLVEGRALPLLLANVDTDAIIPSREIKSVSKTGLADGLFAGWRYQGVGSREPNPDFVLNNPAYAGAPVLLGGDNFGCGSSREHAAWALAEYGFRAIIAPSFNPIFHGNCVRNGILPVQLGQEVIDHLAGLDQAVEISLPDQIVKAADGQSWSFTLGDEQRLMLLEGLDAIDLTLKHSEALDTFQQSDRAARPWIYLEHASV